MGRIATPTAASELHPARQLFVGFVAEALKSAGRPVGNTQGPSTATRLVAGVRSPLIPHLDALTSDELHHSAAHLDKLEELANAIADSILAGLPGTTLYPHNLKFAFKSQGTDWHVEFLAQL